MKTVLPLVLFLLKDFLQKIFEPFDISFWWTINTSVNTIFRNKNYKQQIKM